MKKILVLLILSLLVISCNGKKGNDGTAGSGKEIELSFWNPFGGPDAQTMNNIIMEFNKENKGKIKVKPQSIDNAGGAYYEKIRVSAQSGSSPDVAIMHIDQMPLYAAMGILSEITSTDTSKAGINGSDYIESAWKGTEYKGKRYAIPLDVHPMVLWYNKDLIKDDQVPKTINEVIEKSKEFNAGGKFLFGMPNNPFVISRIFYGGLVQNGGKAVSDDGLKAEFNSQSGIDALTAMAKFANDPKLNPKVGADVVNMFKQGKIAMIMEGIWMLSAFKDMHVGAISWDQFFGDKGKGMWASSHTFVVPAQKSEISPEKKEAIITFIKYITEHSLEWSKAGLIPANKTVHALPEFKALPIQSAMAENLDSFAIWPAVPTFAEIWSGIERLSNEVILGKKDAKTALDEAAKEGEAKATKQMDLLK